MKEKHIKISDYLIGEFDFKITQIFKTKKDYISKFASYKFEIDGFYFEIYSDNYYDNIKEYIQDYIPVEADKTTGYKTFIYKLDHIPEFMRYYVHKWITSKKIRMSDNVRSNLNFCETSRVWFFPNYFGIDSLLKFSTGFTAKCQYIREQDNIRYYQFRSKYSSFPNYLQINGDYGQTVQHGLNAGGSTFKFII